MDAWAAVTAAEPPQLQRAVMHVLGPELVQRRKDEIGWVQYRNGRVLRLRSVSCRLEERRVVVEGVVDVWNAFRKGWESGCVVSYNVRGEVAEDRLEALARALATPRELPPLPRYNQGFPSRVALIGLIAVVAALALLAPLVWLLWG